MGVSQRFYVEAASHWLRETVLDFHKPKHLEAFIGALRPSLAASITRIHVNWPDIWHTESGFAKLGPCCGLRLLSLTLNEGLHVFEDKLYFVDDLGEPEFRQLRFVSQLLAGPSLTSVTLLPGVSEHVDGEKDIQQWHKNLKALEDYINEALKDQKGDQCTARLYRGTGSLFSLVTSVFLRATKPGERGAPKSTISRASRSARDSSCGVALHAAFLL